MKCPFKLANPCYGDDMDESCDHKCIWRVRVKEGGTIVGYTCAVSILSIAQSRKSIPEYLTLGIDFDTENVDDESNSHETIRI